MCEGGGEYTFASRSLVRFGKCPLTAVLDGTSLPVAQPEAVCDTSADDEASIEIDGDDDLDDEAAAVAEADISALAVKVVAPL